MILQQVSFNNRQVQFQQKKVEVTSSMSNSQKEDSVDISAKTDIKPTTKENNKTYFEKIALGALATATITGIGLFIFRKNIARNIAKEPSLDLKSIKIKDDTIEQAVSYIANNDELLGSKTQEELLKLSKHASEKDLASIMAKYLRLARLDTKSEIKFLEPLVEKYFKCEKPSYEQVRQISSLAYSYNKEEVPIKAYELLSKAGKKWPNEPYQSFNESLVDLYSQREKHNEVISVWLKANEKAPIPLRGMQGELVPVLKSYSALDNHDEVINIFKKSNNFYNEECVNLYIKSMCAEGKNKQLIEEIIANTCCDAKYTVNLLKNNETILKINKESQNVVDVLAEIMKVQEDMGLSWRKTISNQNILTRFDNCINKLKNKTITEQEAENILELTRSLGKIKSEEEQKELLNKLYATKYIFISEENPTYKWLIENLKQA